MGYYSVASKIVNAINQEIGIDEAFARGEAAGLHGVKENEEARVSGWKSAYRKAFAKKDKETGLPLFASCLNDKRERVYKPIDDCDECQITHAIVERRKQAKTLVKEASILEERCLIQRGFWMDYEVSKKTGT